MTTPMIWLVILAAALVAVAGLLASTETALARISRVRVEELVRDDGRPARMLAEVVADPPRYLNLVLLLRVSCGLAATVIVASVCTSWLGENWGADPRAGPPPIPGHST